jgi:hypothetical protein
MGRTGSQYELQFSAAHPRIPSDRRPLVDEKMVEKIAAIVGCSWSGKSTYRARGCAPRRCRTRGRGGRPQWLHLGHPARLPSSMVAAEAHTPQRPRHPRWWSRWRSRREAVGRGGAWGAWRWCELHGRRRLGRSRARGDWGGEDAQGIGEGSGG